MSKQTQKKNQKKTPQQKHQLTARIAVGLIALALVVGVVALLNRSDGDHGTTSAGGKSSTVGNGGNAKGATPSAGPTLDVPKKLVDPLKGKNYCATAKLLAYYTHQSYGLNANLGLTEGKAFDKRLVTIASTFERLASQAQDNAKVSASSSAWTKAAKATRTTEDAFKASGRNVQSQVMIVQLAQLSKVIRTQVPKATVTLQSACGLSPQLLGF